jgi:hypothetical protein
VSETIAQIITERDSSLAQVLARQRKSWIATNRLIFLVKVIL